MATATRTGITGKTVGTPSAGNVAAAAPGAQRPAFSDRIVGWVKAHRQIASWLGAIVVVGAVLFVWTMSTRRRTEEIASRDLQGARFAFENMGRSREAGEAYENGSAGARLDFLKAQLVSDAGRAWTTAGDTTKAVAAYRKIVKDFAKEGMASEAKVRLGELTKGTVS